MVAGPSPESQVGLQSWGQSSSRVEFKLTVVNGRASWAWLVIYCATVKKKKFTIWFSDHVTHEKKAKLYGTLMSPGGFGTQTKLFSVMMTSHGSLATQASLVS